ncbi:hypothetical protein JHK82_017431 [Glycine max]|nr:hypothetical protein JHK85_017873 [Glycine max]KAG5141736.1 hypothetical protein JHK82_017431 [Glycine max]
MDNFCPCFFVSLFTCDVSATSSTQLMSNQTQGTCQLSSAELLGFTCDCESGWKKPNIGSIELPPCSFPNCTVNFNCGNGSPAPPSSPPTQVSDRTFGGDCNGFDLGFSSETPPPPATSGTASPGTTASSGETLSCTGELHMLAMTILALIFQIYLDLKGT